MKVSLTFDNGPDPAVTPGVLRDLAGHGIRATFFVLGQQIGTPEQLDIVAAERAAGHIIGNHTFSHVQLGTISEASAAISEIERTQERIASFVSEDKLFRPAGDKGSLDNRLLSRAAYDHLLQKRYSCVLWNYVAREWEDPQGWVSTALAEIAHREWTVLVIHDIATGAMEQLSSFLGRAREAGAEFTTAFPDECVPLWRGQPRRDMSGFVTSY